MKTIDMRFIRYLNLFEKVTKVSTKYCFSYNNEIIFVVPENTLSKAIGEEGKNVKKLFEILGKKIKIVSIPKGDEDARDFVTALVYPLKLRGIELTPTEVIINAGRQSKAMLIGRNKTRLEEMQDIVKEYFNRQVKIV